MSNITENVGNSTTGANLYCVWVPVHDDAGDRLVSIWIDRALTAFQAQMQGRSCEVDSAIKTHAEREEDGGDQREADTLIFSLPARK